MKDVTAAPDWSAIPAPKDDGATAHLRGARLPSVPLTATDGTTVDLSRLRGRTVLYAYPRTGQPGIPNPKGWDLIPGARGCTPQTCAFRDHHARLLAAGVDRLYGVSTQDSAYQQEAVQRLHLPFPLLSDEALKFADALGLPTFEVLGVTLLKRFTLIIDDGVIEHVFYPVFPPDAHATEVAAWCEAHRRVAG